MINSSLRKGILFFVLSCTFFHASAQIVENFKAHATYLSSDKLEGRGIASRGGKLAATYIANQFKEIGLEAIHDDSYFQSFTIPDKEEKEHNVVGIIRAKVPTERSIVFTAHYDAYGIVSKEEFKDDSIHNGALDNAIGVAALIELARIYESEKELKQNLVFIATAAEEFGLYGSIYYTNRPVFPLDQISMNLNIDGFNVSGPREDYYIMPRQGVDFIDEIQSVASPLGWVYAPPDWIDGMNKSFDTASFLSKGVPAFTLWTGDRLKGGKQAEPIPFGRIHTPDDEINEHWNWKGVEDHIHLYKALADYFMANPEGIRVTDRSLFEN